MAIHAKTFLLLALSNAIGVASAREIACDIVIYGGTSAGVAAAVQAKRMGKSVALVCPERRLGGMSSAGLGFTDAGSVAVIGGISREFYHRVWQHYQSDPAWRWQQRDEFQNRGQGVVAVDDKTETMWVFEPHVAANVFEALVRENGVEVYRDEWLDRNRGVSRSDGRIASMTTLSGTRYTGGMFIDASYEGDLVAAADVSYHVGREGNDAYGELHNGVQRDALHHPHNFAELGQPIDPYVTPGDPSSGLLPRISSDPPGVNGEGDRRIQAYCYRLCLTDHPDNRLPIERPNRYDARQYELLLRVFDTGWREFFAKYDPIPNRKTDVNNHGPFSMDNIGFNYDYPEASYERRAEILSEHRAYQQGLLYFLSHDERVPEEVRSRAAEWGLAKDEFQEQGGWSPQLYIREARRMVGSEVMTEHNVTGKRPVKAPVGMGSYTLDSHNAQRYVDESGYVQNEGDIGVRVPPYEIAYGALIPREDECENLLVPVCLSASHIAYGSIRMEPVFMVLGQSAATAAVLSIDSGRSVQEVDYDQLRARLIADGQILSASKTVTHSPSTARMPPSSAELAK
ncbi:FAD-dependent oxidoreductase [Botrimarina hoheduenensis]|uniref:FAD dependent oxidoreductase n=1 Tax=Botrimarina hoheduenensis TaxID=2528000 RepID=A0A5C5VPR7_9BACT|nr:FAD-dependent oxidoreductase [Botrimarina hoheduenensis]TWT40110.1 FAD dependent oxidoreductase [Botrimarina hoheduenensis]